MRNDRIDGSSKDSMKTADLQSGGDGVPPDVGLEELANMLEAFGPVYIDTPPLPPRRSS